MEVLLAAKYAEEHLPRAINIPLKELDVTSVELLDRSTARARSACTAATSARHT